MGLGLLLWYSAWSVALGVKVALAPFYVPSEKAEAGWRALANEFGATRSRLLRDVVITTVSSWVGMAVLALAGPVLWLAVAGGGPLRLEDAAPVGTLVAVVAVPLVLFVFFVRKALGEQAFLEEWGKLRAGPRD